MKRVAILVVTYNAASTLASVLDRIPRDFVPQIEKVIVSDDFSHDSTYLVGLGYQQVESELPLEIIRQSRNLGYGGNQKAGYRQAIDEGLDIVVMLHGDGQYAPEALPEIVAPLIRGECDAVFGSRMLIKGAARKGGMPFYKLIGNKILSRAENAIAGLDLSEWHSGYRAYSVAALKDLPFERNSDGFSFDTEIILELLEAGKRIVEVPIPTFYGDEISHVNGLGYARDIMADVVRYRFHKMGLGTGEMAFASHADYQLKDSDQSSHGRIAAWLSRKPPSRVLDLGCSNGYLGEILRGYGHEVTGVDFSTSEGVEKRLDRFVEANLEEGIPSSVGSGYDIVLAADVLEHVRDPGRLLRESRELLVPGGVVIASIPNFAHWYPRSRVALGRFDYDRRGILDEGHVRFFTRRSFERLAAKSGLGVRRRESTGIPIDALRSNDSENQPGTTTPSGGIDRFLVGLWPTMFGYQFLYELGT